MLHSNTCYFYCFRVKLRHHLTIQLVPPFDMGFACHFAKSGSDCPCNAETKDETRHCPKDGDPDTCSGFWFESPNKPYNAETIELRRSILLSGTDGSALTRLKDQYLATSITIIGRDHAKRKPTAKLRSQIEKALGEVNEENPDHKPVSLSECSS